LTISDNEGGPRNVVDAEAENNERRMARNISRARRATYRRQHMERRPQKQRGVCGAEFADRRDVRPRHATGARQSQRSERRTGPTTIFPRDVSTSTPLRAGRRRFVEPWRYRQPTFRSTFRLVTIRSHARHGMGVESRDAVSHSQAQATFSGVPKPGRHDRPDPPPSHNTSPPIIDVKAKNRVTAVDIETPKI